MKRSLCLGLLFLFHALSAHTFTAKTRITAKAESLIDFSLQQVIDFDCLFNEDFSNCTITFKRMLAKGSYGDMTIVVDSDKFGERSRDDVVLSSLMHTPFTFSLGKDFTVQKPCKRLEDLINEKSLTHDFVSYDLFEQLTGAILSPLSYQKDQNVIITPLFFPFKTKVSLSPNLVLQRKASEIFFDQEMTLVGEYQIAERALPIEVFGELSGDAKWRHGSSMIESLHISHECDESTEEPLFSHPMHFEYHFDIQRRGRD